MHDDPFQKVEELIQETKKKTNIIYIDFHAEATSEKQAFGWYVAGKVSAVIGTHTHTQTADVRILPGGTAYITDGGKSGPRDGIFGDRKESVLSRCILISLVRLA